MMDLDFDLENLTNIPDMGTLCSCPESTGCRCIGEAVYKWAWDPSYKTHLLQLDEKNLVVEFHSAFSVGTAAVRGDRIMTKDRHHYWEVKIMTPVHGTDVMVGVGTDKADLLSTRYSFCSLLGRDSESWGYSYRGYIQHNGQKKKYATSFEEGSLVGVHLDSWRGTLQFLLNRKPLGIAFTGLKGLELYPMVCSTAAKSKMRITYSCSMPASLQMECLSVLSPTQRAYMETAFPALRYFSQSIFAGILKKNTDDDGSDEYESPSEKLILDDFDFALVGCKRGSKRKSIDLNYESDNSNTEVLVKRRR